MSERVPSAPLRVAIVGAGIDAATTAAVLSRRLPRPHFQLVIAAAGFDAPSFGAIETTLPTVRQFHAALGVAEDAVLGAASGAYSLGTAYSGWSGEGRSYFSPFGDIGSALEGVPFHQLAQRLRTAGERVRFGDYSMATMLAQTGRFAPPLDDPRSPLSTYSYGLHLDLRGYAELLFGMAEDAGAIRAEVRFEGAERGPGGNIVALICADGRRIEADIFIDASGAARLLASTAQANWESWSGWLPCDGSVSVECRSDVPPAPYALVTAERFGWRRTVPAARIVGECSAFASSELTTDEAIGRLLATAHGSAASEPRAVRVEPGRLVEPWHRNCIAVGEAAALIEPSASTSLQLLHGQVERLARLFPSGTDVSVLRREFNRLTAQELDRTRDFVILRYKLNRRTGEPLWDRLRAMPVPDELDRKLTQYAYRGRVPTFDGDTFDEIDWALLLDEHGVLPQRYDMLADTIPLEQLKAQFARMRQLMAHSIKQVPLHGEYLALRARSAVAA